MKKHILLGILLTIVLSLCGCSSKPTLDGVYKAEMFASEVTYEFDKEMNVKFKFIIGGYVAISKTGTYEISEDETQITLKFEESESDVNMLPDSMTSLGGSFTFSKGDGYVQIGDMQYNKVTAE